MNGPFQKPGPDIGAGRMLDDAVAQYQFDGDCPFIICQSVPLSNGLLRHEQNILQSLAGGWGARERMAIHNAGFAELCLIGDPDWIFETAKALDGATPTPLAIPTEGSLSDPDSIIGRLDTAFLYEWRGEDEKRRANPFKPASRLAGKDVPPRKWLIDQWVPDQEVTLLYGDGGAGKSLLSLQLAVAVASGTSWIGLLTQPGPAIFLSAEDSEDELHRRFVDVTKAKGIDLANLSNLHYASLAGEDALLAKDGASLELTPLYGRLEEQIKALKPSLVVLDTLANLYPGNENDRAKATQFIGFVKRLAIRHDLAVVVLAHPSLSGLSSGSGTSGSTGWNNSVRSRLYMSRITDGSHEPDVDARVLTKKKLNYGRPGDQIALRWQDGVFVLQSPAHTGADTGLRAQAVFLKLLRLLIEQGRDVSPASGRNFAPKLFADHPENERFTNKAFRAAMEQLLLSKQIIITTTGSASRQKKRLDIAGENHA